MPSSRNGAHDLGPVIRDPTEHEKGAARIVPIEPIEQRVDAARNPARARNPLLARHRGFQRFHLEVFLDVDGKKVRGLI
jgi:hypothetical protein